MRHEALPQKMTVEQLAKWLTENAKEQRTHTEEVPLTEEDKHVYENKVTLATTAIYELQDLNKLISNTIKKGTSSILGNDGQPQRQPQSFTVPPTKGIEELDANRKFATQVLQQGFNVEKTELYGIPWHKDMIFFDIQGKEFSNEPMSEEMMASVGQLFSPGVEKAVDGLRSTVKDLQKRGTTVHMSIGKDLERELFPEEKDESSPLAG